MISPVMRYMWATIEFGCKNRHDNMEPCAYCASVTQESEAPWTGATRHHHNPKIVHSEQTEPLSKVAQHCTQVLGDNTKDALDQPKTPHSRKDEQKKKE